MLQGKALQLEGSPSEADDLVQDTIERALRNGERFQAGTNLSGWLTTIMSHIFIDRRRRRWREAPLAQKALMDLAAPTEDAPLAWRWISNDDLRDAIAQLHPSQRDLLSLFLDGRRSYRDLSDQFGISAGTVGARLWRARQKLRSLLETKVSEGSGNRRARANDPQPFSVPEACRKVVRSPTETRRPNGANRLSPLDPVWRKAQGKERGRENGL
jgi:RNA polymerase sigma-70 factor (ECF subfamily)